MESLYTARKVMESKRVYWVKSYKTLLYYISDKYRQILKPITKGSGSGKRYYIKEKNLAEFIRKFESSEL